MTAVSGNTFIGGYFSLECTSGQGLPWLRSAVGYQSARSAITAVLIAVKPRVVWVPNYICGAVNDALGATGVRVRRYELAADSGVPDHIDLGSSDWLICVDYFGISTSAINSALDRFGPERVLVDASQSLFYPVRPGGTAVYSPRKFVGVPDGGLLRSWLDLPPAREANELDSIARSQHLLIRLSGLVEVGYTQFRVAEGSLENCDPIAMSQLTRRLLESIDFCDVANRRIANYQKMAKELSCFNLKVPSLPEGAVPQCCPVFDVDAVRLRQCLASKSIFLPTYWPDSIIPETDAVANTLRDRTLFLPCDQRYSESEMTHVVRSLAALKEHL